MRILEQILHEVESRIDMVRSIHTSDDEGIEFPDGEQCFEDGRAQGRYEELIWIAQTIRSHAGNDGWIPVSKGLPEEKINPITKDFFEYQVTFKSEDITDIRHYKFGRGHWWNGGGIMDKYVVAWMPLPDPYNQKLRQEEVERQEILIQELQQYKMIGTLEEVGEAVEKQMPKRPIEDRNNGIRYTEVYCCPTCNNRFSGKGIAKYCYNCGQHIDWS